MNMNMNNPDAQLCGSILLFESILTPVSLPSLDLFSEPILIPVSINFEIEPPISESHISSMGKECEFQFFDLESTLELKSTFEPKLDLSHILKLVLVFEHLILEPKSTIPPSHILLLDLGIEQNDSEMIFQD